MFLYQELPSVLFPTVKVTFGLAKCLCAQETSVFAGGIPTAQWSHKNSSNYMELSKNTFIIFLFWYATALSPQASYMNCRTEQKQDFQRNTIQRMVKSLNFLKILQPVRGR